MKFTNLNTITSNTNQLMNTINDCTPATTTTVNNRVRRLFAKLLLGVFVFLAMGSQQIFGQVTPTPGTWESAHSLQRGNHNSTANAVAGLSQIYSATGKYTLSADGVGSTASSMNIRVNKPNAAATVKKAILISSVSYATIANGCVSLSGIAINWDGTAGSGAGFNNYWADVTSTVASQINAFPAGLSNLAVTECNSGQIDGEALLVVFNDATATDKTVIIMFGAATPTGDNFSVTLAQAIDPAAPGALLDMGLGIGFSYQGSDQISQVSVNGTRLTSSAGGQDDGAAANGALITVGGIGDVNTNPVNPYAAPVDTRSDDELYNILPFITNTTTNLTINTINPSNDDNIFLAYFSLSGAAIIGEGALLSQTTSSGYTGTTHTVKAVVKNLAGQAIPNKSVTFTITSGPNSGQSPVSINTDANGEANFTYTGSGGVGTDNIQACFTNSQSQVSCSNSLSFQWTTPPCSGGNWLGTNNAGWFDAANWSCGIPSTTADVVIPAGTANNCVISSGTAQVHNLTINEGASLTNNSALNINGGGNFTNHGIYKGSGAFTGALFTNPVDGIVSPGNSPGCQTFGAGYTNLGSLNIEVNGKTTPCTQYDQITVTGTATIGGTLNVSIGYIPTTGDQINFILADAVTGTFTTVNAPGGWSVQYTGTTVSLLFTCTPPTPSITGPASVCANTGGYIYSTPNVAGNTYSWSVVGGTVTAGAGTNSITVTWGPAGAGTVDVTETESATLCSTPATQKAVTINALPTTSSITGSASICANSAGVTYSVTATGGSTYAWTITGGSVATGAGTNSITVNWGVAGSGNVSVVETNAANCTGTAVNYPVTINANPTTSPITGSASVCANATGVAYSVTPTAGSTYAWTITGGTQLSGTNTSSITVNWGAAGAGNVSVVETNTAACVGTAINKPVTINANPTTSAITGTTPVCANATGVAYSVTPTAGSTYAWTITGGTQVSGTNTSSITVNWGAAGAGNVSVVETNTATCVGTAVNYPVTINPNPTPVISGPASVCANIAGYIYTTPAAAGHSFAWTVVGGIITSGAGSNSITVTWGPAGPGTVNLTEAITATGCSTIAAQENVTINPLPTPVISGAATVCAGTNGSVYSTPLVAGHTYLWTVSGGTISGSATNNSVTINWSITAGSGSVDVTETITATGCFKAATTFAVTKNPTPSITNITAATTCSPNSFSVTPVNGTDGIVPAGTTYIWTAPSGSGFTGGVSGSGTSISGTLINTTNSAVTAVYTVTPTAPTGPCTGASFTVSVTVNPKPAITAITATTACSPNAFSVTPVNGVNGIVPAGTTYSWTAPTGSGFTGGVSGSGTSITGTLTNTTSAAVTAIYTVTPTSGSCVGSTFTVSVTVNPKPSISNKTATTACSPNSFTVTPVDGVGGDLVPTGTTYTWTAPTGSGFTGGVSGSGASITGTLTNTTSSAVTAIYTVTPTSGSCVGSTFTVSVTVNPKPSISNKTATTTCSPNSFTVTPVDGVGGDLVPTGTTYTWTAPTGSGFTGGVSGSGTSITGTLTNTTSSAVTAIYTVTPTSGSCVGSTFTVSVTVNPKPSISNKTATTACSPNSFTVTPVDGVGGDLVPTGTTYTWTAPTGSGFTGGVSGSGASITGTLTNTTSGAVTAIYTVTPTSGSCVGSTFTVSVTVNPKPAINNLTATTACSPNNFSVTPVDGTDGIVPTGTTYTWTAPTGSGFTGGVSGSGSSITGTLTNTTSSAVTAIYTVTPTSGSCVGSTFTVSVTVNPKPSISNKTATTACSPNSFTVTPVDGVGGDLVPTGTTYTWTAPTGSGFTGGVSGSGASITGTLTNTTSGAVTAIYTVTPTSGTCIGADFTVTVTVDAKPAITAMTAVICNGGTFSVTPVDVTNGIVPASTTYSWPAPVVSGITGATSGTNAASISGTLTNTTASPIDVVYTVTPATPSCTGSTFTVTVTVNPSPFISFTATTSSTSTATTTLGSPTAINVYHCDGSSLTFSGFASSFPGQVGMLEDYTSTANVNGGITPGTLTGINHSAASLPGYFGTTYNGYSIVNGTGSGTIQQIYTPYFDVNNNGAYDAGTDCLGSPITFTQTIYDRPAINDITVAAPVCSNVAFAVTPVNGVNGLVPPGTTYSWPAPSVTGGMTGGTSGSGASSIGGTLINTTATAQTAIYTVTPTSPGGPCPGNTFTVTVTINPEPAVTNATHPSPVCSDVAIGSPTYNTSSGVAAATYTIISVNTNALVQSAGAGTGNDLADDAYTNTGASAVNVVYTIKPTSAAGCDGETFTYTVSINPEPAVTNATHPSPVCSDVAIGSPTYNTSSGVAAASYTIMSVNLNGLTQSAGAGTANNLADDAYTNTGASAVNVVYTIKPTSGAGCDGETFTYTVSINPEPAVTNATHPSPVCSDVAIGSPTYNTSSGVAAATYTIISVNTNALVQSAGAGTGNNLADDAYTNTGASAVNVVYTIKPTSGAGCDGETFTYTVSINPEPAVTNATHPSPVCSDVAIGSPTYNTSSGVAAASYTIMSVNLNGLTQSAGAGTANNLSDDAYTNTTASAVNVVYTIKPTSGAGCDGETFTYTVSINPEPAVTNATHPSPICSDVAIGSPTYNTSSGVAAASYTIMSVNLNGLTQSAGAGTANNLADDAYTNTGASAVNVVYTIKPTSGAGCDGETFTYTVSINPEPAVTNATHPSPVCSDVAIGSPTYNTSSGVAAATYTIISVNTNALVQSAGAGTGNNLADDAYTNTGASAVNVVYTIKPTSGAGCDGETFTYTVSINPEPAVTNATHPSPVCSDVAIGSPTYNTSSGVAAASYTIMSVNLNGLTQSAGAGTANNLSDDAYTNTTASAVNVVYTIKPTSGAGCDGETFTYTVSINPEPAVTNATHPSPICSDVAIGSPTYNTSSGVAAASYTIMSVNLNGLTQSAGAGTANNLADDAYTNTGASAVNVVYTIKPTSGAGCDGETFTYTVSINPEPAVTNATHPSPVCSDVAIGSPTYNTSSGVAAASYTIMSVNLNGLTQSAGAGTANNLADDAYTNTTASAVNVVYTIKPTSGAGCDGETFTYTVSINPEPVVANQTATICGGNATNVTINNDPDGPSVQSYEVISITPAPGLVAGPGNTVIVGSTGNDQLIKNEIWRNTTLGALNVVYTLRPTSTQGCVGSDFTVTLTVNPAPIGVITGASNTVICTGQSTNVNINLTGIAPMSGVFTLTPSNGFGAGSTVSFVKGNGVQSVTIPAGNLTNTSPTTDVDYIVSWTSLTNNGYTCSDPAALTGSVTITVKAQPVANITGPAAVCVGSTIALTGTTAGGVWSSSDPTKATVSTSGVVTGVASSLPGSVTISYTLNNGGICFATATHNVTVNPLPVVSCPANSTVCINAAPYTLTGATPTGGTYSGVGVSGNQFNPAVAGLGGHPITYTYTDPATNCTASCTFTITVNSLPTPVLNGPNVVCVGNTIQLSGSPAGGTYNSNNANATVDNTGLVTGVTAGSSVITYTYTDGNSCVGTATKTITINAATPQTITGPSSVCIGSTITLTGTSAGGTWTSNAPTRASVDANSGVVTGIATGSPVTITYTYTNPNGCVSTATQSITVNPLPVVTCPASSNVCVNAAPFTLTGGSPSGGTYTGAGVTSNQFNAATAGVGPHTITYTYTNGNGCTASCSFTITVVALPNATITAASPVCPLSTGNTASVPNAGVGAMYAWSITNGTITAGAGTATITYTAGTPGSLGLTVVVTNSDGCAATGNATVTVSATLPAVSFTGNLSTCAGGTSQLTGSPAGGTWMSSNTGVATIDANGLVTGVSTGTTSITYTYTNGSCTNSVSQNFTVVTISGVITSSSQTVCSGTPVTINISVVPTSGTFGGSFTNGETFSNISTTNGTISVPINSTNGGLSPITKTYTLASLTTPGCSATAGNMSGTASVSIQPVSDLTATPASQNVCNGGTAMVTVSNPNAVGGTYTRQGTYPAGVTHSAATIAANQAYGSFTDVLSNSNTTPKTVTYVFTPVSPGSLGCTGTPVTVTAIVYPNPQISCPTPITGNTDPGLCSKAVTGIPAPAQNANNCPGATTSYTVSGATVIASTPGTLSSGTFNKGQSTVIYTVTDGNGNSSTCSFTITITDNQAPTITCVTDPTVSTNAGVCTYTVTNTAWDPAFSDNCPGTTIAYTLSGATTGTGTSLSGVVFSKGTTTVVWVATDGAPVANVSSCTNTVTVNDTEVPVITCPAPVTINCQDSQLPANTGTATATDNCTASGSIIITYTDAEVPGCGGGKTITRTWKAKDASNNESITCNQVITVNPAALPTMTAPGPITVACGGVPAPSTISFSNAASGGCLISGTSNASTFSATPGACGGTVTETWTATDVCGRPLASVSRTITVSPAALPTMTALGPITVACGGVPSPSTISFSNGLSGGCLISGTSNASTFSATPGACGGTVTETWTATDVCGRPLASVSRTITVSPAALPTMTALGPITVACGGVPSPSTISFSNGLSGGCLISGTSNPSTFSATPGACGGTVTETWTATDVCGRPLASVSRTITVSPAALPTMTALGPITVACGGVPSPSTISFSNGLSGGCLISGTSNPSTFSATPGACGGTVTETWTATDVCGRPLASVSRTITVSPAALPTMTALGPITVACGGVPSPSTISFSNGLSGGCLISGTSNPSTFSATPGACGGTVTETWTATDVCGRPLASVSRTITVSPAALPTMTALGPITVACGGVPSPSTISFSNGLSGGCLISGTSNPSTFSATPGACGGTVTETWTATDVCGRPLASVSRTITVSPAALPTMTALGPITVACGGVPSPSTISFSNGLSGGCLISGTSNPSTFSATPGACGGTVTETWTATDVCGRPLASVSRTITVSPAALPTMTALGPITVACGGVPSPSTISFSNGLSGGCLISGTSNPSTFSATPGACGGTITETWTATDVCGRPLASVSRTITVSPAALPTMTALGPITVACGGVPSPSTISFSNGLSGGCLISGTSNPSTFSATPGACGGTVTETWTATDVCGRPLASVSRTITVSPAALPTMTALGPITVACGGVPSPSTISFSNGLSGGCLISGTSNPSTFSATPGACGGTVTETWTATDVCGRPLASVSRTITVSPAALPTMTALGPITVACGGVPSPSTISFSNGLSGGCLISGTSNPSTFSATPGACGGTVTETWTATDVCGRPLASVSRTITVSPAALPTMTALGPITVACGGVPSPSTISFSNGLSGGCLISGTSNPSTFSATPGACGGTVTETWTATDVCGRPLASVSRTITVSPAALPTMTALGPITVACGGVPSPSTISFSNGLSGGCLISGTSNPSTFSATPGACGGTVTETWTATDVCGRPLASVSRTITVSPAALPTLVNPGPITVNCGSIPSPSTTTYSNGLSGGCLISGVSNTSTFTTVPTHGCGTFTETWTATDVCGRVLASVSRTITVVDNTAPAWTTAPGALNTSVECSNTSGIAAAQAMFPVASDNCDADVTNIVKVSGAFVSGACPQSGTYTNTWTVTDDCGNVSAVYTQVITITDHTAPILATVPTQTLNVGAGMSCTVPMPDYRPLLVSLGIVDCSTYTLDQLAPNAPGSLVIGYGGTRTVVINATDACGNTSSTSFTLNLVDATAPTITCPAAMTVGTNTGCTYAGSIGTATATDNCTATGSIVITNNAPAVFPLGSTTVTWSAKDLANNIATCTQVVTVIDNVAPVITCPANVTVNCQDGHTSATTGVATATDNCDATPVITQSDVSTFSADPSNILHYNYVISRTWTATDISGNPANCVQTITVHDVTAPVVTCPANVTVNCNADNTSAGTGVATATDNCAPSGNIAITQGQTSTFSADPSNVLHYNYVITRTWTATDIAGNASNCIQTITVHDVTAPVVTCPANVTVNCDADNTSAGTGVATATDNCAPSGNIAIAQSQTSTFSSDPSNILHYNYVISRTWTATDVAGNASNCVQTITVHDVTAPVVTCPANVTVNCDAGNTSASTGTATATDNCAPSGNITIGQSQTSTFSANPASVLHYNYVITRTWTATDVAGNSSNCVQTITVHDVTNPVVTCGPNITLFKGANCTTTLGDLTYNATTSDNCAAPANIVVTQSPPIGTVFGASTSSFPITLTATDVAGNSSTCTFTAFFVDNTPPVITCPANVSVNTGAGNPNCSHTASWTAPTTSDNCTDLGPVTLSYVTSPTAGLTNGGVFPAGPTTVTYTATDASGNTANCSFTVTVVDNTAPAITSCATAVNVSCAGAVPAAATDYAGFAAQGGAALDNCSGTTLTVTHSDVTTAGSCVNRFTITRTYTITDQNSNSSTCTQLITVNDNVAPVITACASAVTVTCAAAVPAAATTYAAFAALGGAATDNCTGTLTVTSSDVTTAGSCVNKFTVTRTYTITDVCGNSSTCTQLITVNDNVAPVITTCASAVTVTCAAAVPAAATTYAAFAALGGAATDNCTGTLSVTSSDVTTAGSCVNKFTVTRTYTITDVCGNSSTCTQLITVNDNVAPVITACASAVTVTCAAAVPAAATDYAGFAALGGAATDNCTGTLTVTSSDVTTAGSCVNKFTVTRTYTITDVCGNSSTCTQLITVNDNVAPVITACASAVTVTCAAAVPAAATTYAAFAALGGAATDNCTGTLSVTSSDVTTAGSCVNKFTVTRTYTITDVCGNSSTCTQLITVNDNVAPVITTCASPVTVTCAAAVPAAATDYAGFAALGGAATDNCTGTLTVTSSDVTTAGSCVNKFTVTRTYTITDVCGNSSTCTQLITVNDNVAPVITCNPTPVTGNPNGVGCLYTATVTPPGVTDNCTGTVMLNWVLSGAGATAPLSGTGPLGSHTYGVGTTTITYTATDACGNSSSCTSSVVVTNNLTGTISGTTTVTQFTPTAPNITFTGSGGATPYIFAYNVNGGGTQTVSTTGANTTVTVPQSTAVIGTFVYTLESITDANGCTGSLPTPPANTATVTVTGTACNLSPLVFVNGSNYNLGDTARDFIVSIENSSATSSSGTVTFRIAKANVFNISFIQASDSANVLGGVAITNSDFTFVSSNPSYYEITTSVPIAGNSNKIAGFKIARKPGFIAANTTENISITLVPGTGGDTTPGNNNNTLSVTAN